MEGLVTVAIGLAGVVCLGALVWMLLKAWRSISEQSRLGLMARMMARQGVAAADSAETSYNAEAAAQAVRRCAMCRAVEQCERFLTMGDREGFEAFCPNANYILNLVRDDRAKEAPAG